MPNPHTLFISDLHLAAETTAINKAFIRFCREQAPHAEALYILGDFFNAYIGDDIQSSFHKKIEAELKRLTNAGLPVYFMHGNRDFFVGKKFCRRTGVVLLPDPTVIDLYGRPTLLMHGDSLCTADTNYQKYRKRVRSKLTYFLFMCLSKKRRQRIADQARAKSMANVKTLDPALMDVTNEAVLKALISHQCTQMIHGHTHKPAAHNISLQGRTCKRYVLGDWHPAGIYLRADAEQIELVEA